MTGRGRAVEVRGVDQSRPVSAVGRHRLTDAGAGVKTHRRRGEEQNGSCTTARAGFHPCNEPIGSRSSTRIRHSEPP